MHLINYKTTSNSIWKITILAFRMKHQMAMR